MAFPLSKFPTGPRTVAPLIPQRVSGAVSNYRLPITQTPFQPRPVSQTASQVANQRVNAILQPQLAAQDAYAAQQNQAIRSFAQALMGRLEPIAGQVGADYSEAIQQTGALANQAATFLQQANPTPQVQALLQSAGAPAEQQAQLAGQLGQSFGGGAAVLNFLGGTVPGTKLAEQGAAAQAQAAQYPALAALRGQQSLANALWQQGTDRAKIEAQRGQLYADQLQNIRTNQYKQQQLGLQAQTRADTQAYHQAAIRQAGQRLTQAAQTAAEKKREFGITSQQKQQAADFLNWYRTQGVNATQEKIDQKAQQFGVSSKQAAQRIAVSQQRAQTAKEQGAQRIAIAQQRAQTAKTQGAQRIAQGQQRIEIAKQKAAAKKAGQASVFPNLTKTQVIHLRSGIANAFYGVPEQKDTSGKVTRAALPAVDYPTAINHAIRAGYSRAGATKMANRFYMPGQRGRPKR